MADDQSIEAPSLPSGSSYLFNADAQAILEESPDLNLGLDLLKEAYTSKQWDSPDEAKKVASDYAQSLRYKFQDKTPYSSQEITALSPINLAEVTGNGNTPEEKNVDQVNQWEQNNLNFLDETTDPDYVLTKHKLSEGIKTDASAMRRDSVGKKEGFWTDAYYRAKEGLTGGVAKLVGADDYLKNIHEHTNPYYDENLLSEVAGGAGFVGGVIALNAIPVVGQAVTLGYLGATAAGEVKSTYQDSLERTGDSGRASIAASIEGGSQVIQLYAGTKILGAAGKTLGKAIFGAGTEEAVQSATQVFTGVAKKGLETGTVIAAGGEVSSAAQHYGQGDSPTKDLGARTGKNFLLGMIFGSSVEGLAQGAKAISAGKGNPNPEAGVDTITGVTPPTEKLEGPVINQAATSEKALQPEEQLQFDFVTSDGSQHTVTPEGSTVNVDPETGAIYHATDKTFYVPTETAGKLIKIQQAEAEQGRLAPIITADGKLYVKSQYVDEKLNPVQDKTESSLVPVPAETEPQTDLHPVQVSTVKNTNGNEIVSPGKIGTKITEVIAPPEESVKVDSVKNPTEISTLGAQKVQQRTLGARIETSPVLHPEVREAGAFMQYVPLPDVETRNAAEKAINEKGLETVTAEFLNMPYGEGGKEESIGLLALSERYRAGAKEALAKGDTEAYNKLVQTQVELHDRAGALSTKFGQGLQAQNAWARSLDPEAQAVAIKSSLANKAVKEVAAEEGLTETEVRNTPAELENISQQIETLQKEGARQKKLEGKEQPKAKPGEAQAPEKPDEEFLSPTQQEELKFLRYKKKRVSKRQEKVNQRKAEAFKEFTPEQEEQFKKAMTAAKNSTGDIQKKLFAKAYEIKDTAESNLPSDPFKGNTLYRYWYLNQLSDPTGPGPIKVIGDFIQYLRALPAYALTDVPKGRGIKPLLSYGTRFWSALAEQGIPTFRSEIKGVRTLRPDLAFETVLGERLSKDKGFTNYLQSRFREQPDFIKEAKLPPTLDKLVSKLPAPIEKLVRAIPLRQVGVVARMFSGISNGFYRSMKEAQASYLAERGAGELKLKGQELRDYVAQKLFNTPKDYEGALTQAKQEAETLKGLDINYSEDQTKLRAWDILDEKRSTDIRAGSHAFANKMSFDREPDGIVGDFINGVVKRFANFPIPIGNTEIRPIRYVVNFLNIFGNLLNAKIEHEPILGTLKLLRSDAVGIEKQLQIGYLLTGYASIGALYGLAESGAIQIHGSGPKDFQKLQSLQAQGWRSNSIQVGGQYLRFHETPLGLTLGALGGYFDKKRYDPHFNEAIYSKTLAGIVSGGAHSLTEINFVQNLGNLLDGVKDGDLNKIENSLVSSTKGFVPYAGTLRMISRMFDTPIETYNDFWAKMISGVPIVQRVGNTPSLNAFGEPVKDSLQDRLGFVGRFWSERVTDPEWRWLGDNGYNLPDVAGLTIHTEKTKAGEAPTYLEKKRTAAIGSAYANVLSPEERISYMKELGPQIRSIVSDFRQHYGTAGFSQNIQDRLNDRINTAKQRVLRKIAIGQ